MQQVSAFPTIIVLQEEAIRWGERLICIRKISDFSGDPANGIPRVLTVSSVEVSI